MADRGQSDPVWEHAVNIYPSFTCKYCKCMKKGGGATRFKQHLVGRGRNVVHCTHVSPDVHDYFRGELDRTADRKKERMQENMRREQIAVQDNGIHCDDNDDEVLQCVLHMSR